MPTKQAQKPVNILAQWKHFNILIKIFLMGINTVLLDMVDVAENKFTERYNAAVPAITELFNLLYQHHPDAEKSYTALFEIIKKAFDKRSERLKNKDILKQKNEKEPWFLNNRLSGMSLYVDRFCGTIKTLRQKLYYFEELGINLLHLMPLFESPKNESDGGYAVANFRKIDKRFGNLNDLDALEKEMKQRDMFLMLDIVLNHTSHKHEWALKAKQGEKKYQDYFYFFDDRTIPDELEKTMPEVFPESSPGNFTYVEELDKWVMSVFHNYQWDLNYRNPAVFNEMMDTVFFYANLGVDVLRIDAPAFIWKQNGTSGQNLEEAHTILKLIKQCVHAATPGMALLAEAIVAPSEIMKYFGTGKYLAQESDFAYNATQMALQWDALGTGDTRVMLAAQEQLLQKPYGTTWITYTRCHDDIGLGYDDKMIGDAGYNPYEHRRFLKNYYSGVYPNTPAKGALFSVNEKTGDARISGTLASLCGLEKAIENEDEQQIKTAVQKITLMQAQSFFIGGVPMLFYGDEQGYTNDYSYLDNPDKNYDNRWMHRPLLKWNGAYLKEGTIENKIFYNTQSLLAIRKKLEIIADKKNLTWINTSNNKVAGFLRAWDKDRIYCIFNFSNTETGISWYSFKQNAMLPVKLFDLWEQKLYNVGNDHEMLTVKPYQFLILEPR
jgi:amylosucrase